MCSGRAVLTVRPMHSLSAPIAVDTAGRTVTVAASTTWGQLDAATQQHGLAVTGARVSSSTVGGVAVGAGSGWLQRALGLTSDSLVAARVLLPSGVEVDADDDLLFALRGGGPGFGRVTELTLRLHPVGPEVVAGMRLYPLDRAPEVLAAYAAVMAGAPDELCGGVAFLVEDGRPAVGVVALWAGEPGAAPTALGFLDALGAPLRDGIRPIPYVLAQKILDARVPEGGRCLCRAGFLDALDDAAIDVFCQLGSELENAASHLLLQPLGGAFARPAVDTALGHRDAAWAYELVSIWTDPRQDVSELAWSRAAEAELEPIERGTTFPSYLGDGRRQVAWEPETRARLDAIAARL